MQRPKSLLRTILQPLAVAVGLAVLARGAIHIYSIPSSSMAPTLLQGDQIVVTPYLRSDPERGDVIVFHSTAEPQQLLVKRVVALPGDLVDSRLGRLRIGGHTVAEPYLLAQAASGAIQAQIVPAGSYFVLGDNREESLDSRSWGVVQRAQVVGRARLVLWSAPHGVSTFALADADAAHDSGIRVSAHDRIFKWID